MLVTVTVLEPLFFPVTSFPKARVEGVAETSTIPVPLRLTFCVPLSVTVSTPLREPSAEGVSVTEISQLALGARVAGLIGQLVVSA